MSKQLKLYSTEENNNNVCEVKTRKLKVYYAAYQNTPHSHHPFIRVAGKYLLDFGFKIGDTLELTLSTGQIVIRKVKPA